jgi:hypothetical protein
MNALGRPGRCWFCGKEHLAVGDPPEHVVQAALGGTLTTDRVAEECNTELGKSIDEPFLDDFFIALERVFFDIRDPRRRQDRPPPNPRHEAELADGTPIKVEMRGGPWQPMIEPRLLQDDEKVFRITAPSVEIAEEMMQKKLERLQRDGIDVSSTSIERVENREAVEAKVNVSIDGTIRVRAVAKMALAVLSKVLPDEWLDSPDAERLLGWLRADKPRTVSGDGVAMAAPTRILDLMAHMCAPPEHLIFFQPSGHDTVNLLIVLFGREVLGQRIQLHGVPTPAKIGWAIDPKPHTLEETNFEQLALRVVRAMAETDDERPAA